MSTKLLQKLERALRQRNPILADRLRPGLPELRIRRMLHRAKVEGWAKPLLNLYAWKDGTEIDPGLTQEQASAFPGSVYMFMELETMIVHRDGFAEGAAYQPKMVQLVGRYFPLFWDGSTGYLALDLAPAGRGRVVLIEVEWEDPVREAYRSFDEFLKDAIRANLENDGLTCLQSK